MPRKLHALSFQELCASISWPPLASASALYRMLRKLSQHKRNNSQALHDILLSSGCNLRAEPMDAMDSWQGKKQAVASFYPAAFTLDVTAL